MQQYSLNALWPEKTRAWPGIGPRLYPDWVLRWGPPDWGPIGARLAPASPRAWHRVLPAQVQVFAPGFCSGRWFRVFVPGAGSGLWFRALVPVIFCPGPCRFLPRPKYCLIWALSGLGIIPFSRHLPPA